MLSPTIDRLPEIEGGTGLGVERECLVIQEGVAQWPSEALDGVKVATD